MSRSFVAASSQYLQIGSAVVTAYPVTMACWFLPTDITQVRSLMTIGANGSNGFLEIKTNGGLTINDSDLGATTIFNFNNTLHHAVGVFTSGTSRTPYLDGVAGSLNTGASSPTLSPGKTTIGAAEINGTRNRYFDGTIAEAAIWNVALDAAEIVALSVGVSPLLIRPTGLVAYWPLVGQFSPEIELRGRNELTVTGATAGAHVRMFYPAVAQLKLGKSGALLAADATLSLTATAALTAPARLAAAATLAFTPTAALTATARLAAAATLAFTTTARLVKPGEVTLHVNGTDRSWNYDRETLEIHDDLNELPNTATFDCFGFTPANADIVRVTTGVQKDFEGTITSVTEYHDRLNGRTVFRVSCTDYTYALDAQLVTKAYGSQSATTTGQDLVTNFSSGFTQTHIAASLPTVAAIQFKMTPLSSALRQLCDAFGGDTYVDYDKDVHLFETETDVVPATIQTSNRDWRAFKYQQMIERVANRIFVEGGGVAALAEVAVGETIIPVEDTAWYAAAGGAVIAGNQILSYTAARAGGAGSLVGSGAAPSAAPSLALTEGGGTVDAGVHSYAVSFVTAAGESLVGPSASATTGAVLAAPTAGPAFVSAGAGVLAAGYYGYATTFVTAAGETTASASTVIHSAGTSGFNLGSIQTGAANVTARKVYRTVVCATAAAAAAAQLKLLTTIANNTATTYADSTADGSLGANVPTSNTAVLNEVALTGIPIGASTVTSRKVYRTAAGGSQLKLLTTIANNTATTYTDALADATLGANAPTLDTSGLSQPTGQVTAGSTTLLVAGTAFALSGGGWAVIGNGTQLIRYTGITASSLTGIPASGVGSITASIGYNSTVTAAPMLTGIPASGTGSVVATIKQSDEINLLVQRDDPASQALYGIRHAYVADRRLAQAGAQARGDAELTLHKDPGLSGSFITEDSTVRSGRQITIALSSEWGIAGTFTISQVRIFWDANKPNAQREVTFTNHASDKDLYRLLRRIQEQQQQNAA